MRITGVEQLELLNFTKANGMVPVVAQHARTGEVLTLAFATRDALVRTITTGEMWFFSRTRNELWHKGATSGNVLKVVSLHTDCDTDSVLVLVEPTGPSCHTGAYSCFDGPPTLAALAHVLEQRMRDRPEGSYTSKLLGDRNLRLKKIGEEAAELAVACADEDADQAAQEAADLMYHALVACAAIGVNAGAVLSALEGRLPDRT
jgi:phosphoribosyl-ATP pyrophosphohydrolase/phosphoribosyl-AMP cyclohydrolase